MDVVWHAKDASRQLSKYVELASQRGASRFVWDRPPERMEFSGDSSVRQEPGTVLPMSTLRRNPAHS